MNFDSTYIDEIIVIAFGSNYDIIFCFLFICLDIVHLFCCLGQNKSSESNFLYGAYRDQDNKVNDHFFKIFLGKRKLILFHISFSFTLKVKFWIHLYFCLITKQILVITRLLGLFLYVPLDWQNRQSPTNDLSIQNHIRL